MMYLIGMGLSDEYDLSIKALEKLKKCDSIYCELYTNKWIGDLKNLEKLCKNKIKILERIEVESDFLIKEAKTKKIALLVPGDPLTATTHVELLIEAKKNKIKTEIVHASSVFTAISESGLQSYKYGRTTTLVFQQEKFKPTSPYDVISKNKEAGLHSIVLLDIHSEDEKYMTPREGLSILLDIENEKRQNVIKKDTKVVVLCALGSDEQLIKYNTIENLMKDKKIDRTPAVLVVPGEVNFKEEEALRILTAS